MTLVSIQEAMNQAERLMAILDEIGANHVPGAGVQEGFISLWEILDEVAHPGDADDPKVIQRHVAGAGLHDLAAKICMVWDELPEKRQVIKPHLKLLAETCFVGQNQANERWTKNGDVATEHGNADKVIELYWGCLCLLAGMEIELDDPVHSSKGKNPDVLATASDKTTWAFAIKTLAETKNDKNVPKNLLQNLLKGLDQIKVSEAEKGFVVVNFKNVLDHDLLRKHGPYHTWEEANHRLTQQIKSHLESFYRDEVVEIKQKFEMKGKLAPVFVIVAHSSVLCYPPASTRPMWTEIKTMFAKYLPNQDGPSAGSFGAEAWALAEKLNDVMQTRVK